MSNLRELRAETRELNARIRQMRELSSPEARQALLTNTLTSLEAQLRPSNLTSYAPLQQNNIYAPTTLNWQMLTWAYKTHGPLQTAMDQPCLDAVRGGVDISTKQVGPEELVELEELMVDRNDWRTIATVGSWSRLYGGSALIVNDGTDPETPLDLARARMGRRVHFYSASRWELGSPMKDAEFYLFYGQRVHHSRVITLMGKEAPYPINQQLQGWGMSEMERMIEPFNVYLRAMNAIYELLLEAKVDVYRLKGFNRQLAGGPKAQRQTRERVEAANRLKGYLNAVLLDSDDEYVQKQVTFTGLAEMSLEARMMLCSSIKFPMTKLFGTSPTGLSGDDESGTENYNSMVESEPRPQLRPIIRIVTQMRAAELFGAPLKFSFKYKSLRVLKATEEETVKTEKNQRYAMLYDKGVMTAPEWAAAAHKDGIVQQELASEKGEDFPLGPMQSFGAEGVEQGGDGKFGREE